MKRKSFLTLALGCMLCIALVAIGVYAVSYLKLNVTGTIDFISFDKLVYIEKVEIKNFVETTDNGQSYNAKTKVLEEYSGKYLRNSDSVSPINLSTLSVIQGEDLIIEFTFVSLFADYDLYATASSTAVAGVSVSAPAVKLPKNIGESISTGTSAVFTIKISNTSSGIVNLGNLSINISFETIEFKTGTDSNGATYHYLEMGTYNGSPVQWRYVADESGARYSSENAPTMFKGYYVLETKVTATKVFLASSKYTQNTSDSKYYHNTEGYTNIYAHDYGISDIRAYLTNTGSGGFMEALGITKDSIVYQMIKSRSITDLYSNIVGTEGTAIDATNANYSLSLSGDKDIKGQSDKFWLMSRQEADTFFADQASRIWDSSSALAYWLRSPYSSDSYYACNVFTLGIYVTYYVHLTFGVRAAFKI